MKYMKVFYDWLEGMEALDYTERGRLFTALLEYARGEEASALEGNERFIFPAFRNQIDRDQAQYGEYLDRQRENGKKGGRPSTCNSTENPRVFSETRKSQDKDEDKDQDKEKDYNKDEDDDKDLRARAREERVVGVVVDGSMFGFSQRAREEAGEERITESGLRKSPGIALRAMPPPFEKEGFRATGDGRLRSPPVY